MLTGRKLALTLAFAGLLLVAFGAGCRGFFVQPILSSIAVGPANPTIATGTTGNTVQFTAFGTFNDGSSGNPAVTWNSASPDIATISAGGLATAVSTGTSTITATSVQNPTISGTQLLTVTTGCITSIALTPNSLTLSNNVPVGNFTAKATTCNGVIDITAVANWITSNSTVATVSAGQVTAFANGTSIIQAQSGGVSSPTTNNQGLVTVTGFQ